jgi:hypothetical protein
MKSVTTKIGGMDKYLIPENPIRWFFENILKDIVEDVINGIGDKKLVIEVNWKIE